MLDVYLCIKLAPLCLFLSFDCERKLSLLKITSYTSWSHRYDRLLVFPSQKWSEMNWNWAKADGFVGYISTKREERNEGKNGISHKKRDNVFYKNVTKKCSISKEKDRETEPTEAEWSMRAYWTSKASILDEQNEQGHEQITKQTRARRSLTFDFTTARWMMPGLEGKTCRRSNYYDLW